MQLLLADKAYANPHFYRALTNPVLIAIALQVSLDLGCGAVRVGQRQLPPESIPIEFAWFDVGDAPEHEAFFTEYWPLISPDGGTVLFHYTVNNPGPAAFVRSLQQRKEFEDLEIVSLLEPHKLAQNSFTLIRRTCGLKETPYLHDPGLQPGLKESALALLTRRGGAAT